MAVFEYRALNQKGKTVAGFIDADSRAGAGVRLKQQGLFPTSVSKIRDGSAGGKDAASKRFRIPGGGLYTLLGSRIGSGEIAMVTRLIATLLSAGFPLVDALSTVAGQTRSKAFQKVLSRIKDQVEEGTSLADALALNPKVFSGVYVNMVAAGESSGTLEIVLEQLASFAEKREATRKKIQAALAYPLIVSVIGFLVLVVLMTYIVPGIVGIFSDINQHLPGPTLMLIAVSGFFKSFWWAVVLLPFALVSGLVMIRKTEWGLRMTDQAVLSLPLAGTMVGKLAAARFARTLGSLLENGVPLLTGLKITRNVAGNKVLSDLIEAAAVRVEQGGELGEAMSVSRDFPALAAQMIKVGEKSGQMEKMLEKSADLFEGEVESAVTALASMVEPLIILLMGVAVGLIVMAICLPIVEINQMAGG